MSSHLEYTLDASHHRYPVYLESEAWATNFKTKLASGSAVLIPSFKHPEFFARDLIPYVHYVPIDVDDLCEDLVTKVGALDWISPSGSTLDPRP